MGLTFQRADCLTRMPQKMRQSQHAEPAAQGLEQIASSYLLYPRLHA